MICDLMPRALDTFKAFIHTNTPYTQTHTHTHAYIPRSLRAFGPPRAGWKDAERDTGTVGKSIRVKLLVGGYLALVEFPSSSENGADASKMHLFSNTISTINIPESGGLRISSVTS